MALPMERLLFLRSAIPGATYLPDAKPIPISVATGPPFDQGRIVGRDITPPVSRRMRGVGHRHERAVRCDGRERRETYAPEAYGEVVWS
jgi:hypothetical protein